MNIEQQKQTAKKVLSKIKALDSRAIIAGGAARDWYFNNLANDIDIFYFHEEGKYCLDNIRRETAILKAFLGVSSLDVVGFNSGKDYSEPQDDFNNYLKNPNIVNVFEKGEVDQIYLNFSDPWPKDRHAKRRLTSRQFLERYHNILKEEGRVIFKTDNRPLFDFSLEEVKEAGWTLEKSTFDLHHSEYVEGNIMTEYEEKFVAKGNPICMLQIFLQEDK